MGSPHTPTSDSGGLVAPPPGSTRGRILFALKSLSVVRRGRFDATYSRDLGLADLALRLSRWPVVYEAHTSSPLVSEETPHLYRTEKAPSRRKLERLKRRERR